MCPDYRTEGRSSQIKIIEEFCADNETVQRLEVTPEEREALSRASLFGSLTCKDDVLFILRQIREVRTPIEPEAPPVSEEIQVPYHRVEPSIPDIGEMSESIRRVAMARLSELDALTAERRSTPWRRIKTMLNWRNPSTPNYRAS